MMFTIFGQMQSCETKINGEKRDRFRKGAVGKWILLVVSVAREIGDFAYYGLFCFFTARKRSLGQGNNFRSMCQEFCRGGGAVPACIAGDIPACLAADLGGGRVGIPACLAGFQAHAQGGSWGRSGQGGLQAHTWGGLLPRGACSRGWGCLLQRCVCGDPPVTATAAGGTHPIGMHSFLSEEFYIIPSCQSLTIGRRFFSDQYCFVLGRYI